MSALCTCEYLLDGVVVSVLASRVVDTGSSPIRVKSKTNKLAVSLDCPLLIGYVVVSNIALHYVQYLYI
jgi:hypothetical protein